jgi:hypothetical protein
MHRLCLPFSTCMLQRDMQVDSGKPRSSAFDAHVAAVYKS